MGDNAEASDAVLSALNAKCIAIIILTINPNLKPNIHPNHKIDTDV